VSDKTDASAPNPPAAELQPDESKRPHRPLFAPYANSAIRLALVLALVMLVALPTFFIAWARTPYSTGASDPVVQPVMFDHRHHYRDDGIDCRYCHYAVDRSPYAGVPATEVCMNCHSQVWNDAPLLSRVRASFFSGKPIEWERVNALPDHVFFNHAVHVNRGVGCVSCHGRVDLMGQVYQAQPLTMAWCLDCHRAPENHLRPQEQITNMEWAPDRPQRDLGLAIKAAREIAPPTHCSACHR
jgi:hypothetical protein